MTINERRKPEALDCPAARTAGCDGEARTGHQWERGRKGAESAGT